jgi:hypothetical protein
MIWTLNVCQGEAAAGRRPKAVSVLLISIAPRLDNHQVQQRFGEVVDCSIHPIEGLQPWPYGAGSGRSVGIPHAFYHD